MSGVPVWSGFAYKTCDDDRIHDVRRELADWQVEDWVRWAVVRGFDNIYLCRTGRTVEFEQAEPSGLAHEMS